MRALGPNARAVRVRCLADNGHVWYLVPRRLLDELGVAPLLSRYSYVARTGRMVYVECDFDMMHVAAAIEAAGAVMVVRGQLVTDAESVVRQRERFEAPVRRPSPPLARTPADTDLAGA